jgi:nitrogen-specific signal transduction histidine kinase
VLNPLAGMKAAVQLLARAHPRDPDRARETARALSAEIARVEELLGRLLNFARRDERMLSHPFFTTKPNGHGLGLAISQNIAVGHGGRIVAGNRPAADDTRHRRRRPFRATATDGALTAPRR